MTWTDLFERAAGFDVDEAAVTDALADRRERRADDADDVDDGG